jgi:hypothetical protein
MTPTFDAALLTCTFGAVTLAVVVGHAYLSERWRRIEAEADRDAARAERDIATAYNARLANAMRARLDADGSILDLYGTPSRN